MANIGDIYTIRVYCAAGDQMAVNVFSVKANAKAGSGGTDADLAAAYNTLLATPYKAILPDSVTYRGVQVQRAFPLPPTIAVANVSSSGVGLVAGDILPRQVSGILTKTTVSAGKSYRGRMYIPFPAESANDVAGLPTAGYLTSLTAIGTALMTNVSSGGGGNTNNWNVHLWSKKLGTYTIVASFIARSRWATQRRRGSFGRTNVLPI